MRNLQDILYGVSLKEIIGPNNKEINKITFDSRSIEKGDLFVAILGVDNDGHNYIDKAVSSGADVILCEVFPSEIAKEVTYVKTDNTQKALGLIAANYFDNPSEKLSLVGVTGTNGKTSIATLH